MKNLHHVRSISTVLLALLLTSARAEAPLAILADVVGSVQLVRGGKTLAAKAGTKLNAGDRVVSRGGKATIYYLGRAPQKLSTGASATIGASVAGKSGGVWNSVYAGVSGGFDARPRVAAAVRGDDLPVLLAPVESLVAARPRFAWRRSDAASDYEIVVSELDAKGVAREIWHTQTPNLALEYPTTASALKAGVQYRWSVAPRANGRVLFEPVSSWFRVASPEANATLQSGLKELSALPDADTRRTAQAAWSSSRGFRALALQSLGVDETTVFGDVDETQRALLRSILTAEQQRLLLDARPSVPVLATQPLVTSDAGLPIDGRFSAVPREVRKRYVDDTGAFAIEIPQTWGALRQSIEDITRTDFGPQYAGEVAIGVVVAPLKTGAVPAANAAKEATVVTARLLEMARANGVVFEITQSRGGKITQNGVALPAHETAVTWREKREKIDRQWRGAMTEFAANGKSYVLGWSAVVGDSTIEFDRTVGILRDLQQSFVATTDAGAPKTSVIAPEAKEIQAQMMRPVNVMTEANERTTARNKVQAASFELGAARQRYEAAAPGTLARADAAIALARATEDAAWTIWGKATELAMTSPPAPNNTPQNDLAKAQADADEAWKRADTLRAESYRIETQLLEKEIEATNAHLVELRAQTYSLPFANSHAFIIDSWLDVQAMRASNLQSLAFDARDRDPQEKWARRELEFRRTQLQLQVLSSHGNDALMQRAEFADALESLGAVLLGRSDYEGAEAHYRRALVWRKALPETFAWRGLEGTWRNLGSLALNSGDLTQAREYYLEALRAIDQAQPLEDADYAKRNNAKLIQMRRSGRASSRTIIWNSLGFIADGLGDYRLARENYEQALKQVEDLSDDEYNIDMKRALKARSLNNLGALESASGNLDAAMKYLDASQVLLRERGDASGLAIWMMNRASLLEQRGDREGARRAALDARTRFLALRVPARVAFATAYLARLARFEGDSPQALQLAREALQLARTTKDSSLLAQATRGLAVSLSLAPEPDWREFDALIAESLKHAERIASPIQQSATLDSRAQGRQARGDLDGAEADYRAAIARLEAVRATAASAENFSNSNTDSYERLVRLLLNRNRPEEAFDVLQRARSSKLRENLRLGTLKSPDPALQKLLDRATALETKLRTLREQRETALAAPTPDAAAVENLEGLIASTQAEFFAVSARLKKANPAFDRALTISPLELKKASTSFPTGTVLVQYALLEDELYVFVVTRERLKIYQPKVRSNSVLEAARGFRTLMDAAKNDARAGKPLATPETDAALRASLTELYKMLIAPIEGELRGQKILAFVPSGALYYVPLHALARTTPQGLRFLIEDIPVAYLAAGDVLSVVQSRDDERFGAGALALGDPTGAELPEARKEARAVAQIMPASESMVGDAAQKSVLLDSKNLNRRVLHLAMHGVLNAALPDDSYIQLAGKGEESRLRVGEIVGLDLNRIDLVTLSACQTALGERAPSGGEISSLAQSFSSAGAPSVIASLWSVEDDSTRQLMEEFYRSFASGGGKAVSLQRAQIALLKQPATRHPFYWAPFELLGDWR